MISPLPDLESTRAAVAIRDLYLMETDFQMLEIRWDMASFAADLAS
jgi:hypothetical protein